jgi:hypothetical protein
MVARLWGVVGEIPPLIGLVSNADPEPGSRTMSGGRFDWGGRLLKSNGGARRSPYPGWKSGCTCKGRRWLNCETNKSSRYESRS